MENILKETVDFYNVILDGDAEGDVLLALQEDLVNKAHAYATLVKRPEITDQQALEAICFLAVVETQVGLDEDLLTDCLLRLEVSYHQLWGTILILERFFGIVADDLLNFIFMFTKRLQEQLQDRSGGYN